MGGIPCDTGFNLELVGFPRFTSQILYSSDIAEDLSTVLTGVEDGSGVTAKTDKTCFISSTIIMKNI